MARASKKRQWRSQDDSEVLDTIRRQAVEHSVTVNPEDDFEEDIGNAKLDKRTILHVKKLRKYIEPRPSDIETGKALAVAKAQKRTELKEKKKVFDLWDSAIVKGPIPAPVTRGVAVMPALVVPDDDQSANPEPKVWENALQREAAISRSFLGLDINYSQQDEDDSTDVESAVKDDADATQTKQVKDEPLPEQGTDNGEHVCIPSDDEFAVKTQKRRPGEKNQELKSTKKNAIHPRERQRLQKMRAKEDVAGMDTAFAETERELKQSASTTEHKAHVREEEERLLSQGILPDGVIKIGRRTYVESGTDVLLPKDSDVTMSMRQMPVPVHASALRERAASFFKRGMVEITGLKVLKRPAKKLVCRVRSQ